MEKQKLELSIGEKVRLKDGPDNLYKFACAGSVGWVRDTHFDRFNYPMVFIEWDRDDPYYNGEQDKWAFQADFEQTESNNMTEPEKNFEDLMSRFKDFLASEGVDKSDSALLNDKNLDETEYAEALEYGMKTAKEADSFMLIAESRIYDDDDPRPILVPSVIEYYKSPEGGLLLESHLASLAALSHQELAIDRIKAELDDES